MENDGDTNSFNQHRWLYKELQKERNDNKRDLLSPATNKQQKGKNRLFLNSVQNLRYDTSWEDHDNNELTNGEKKTIVGWQSQQHTGPFAGQS